MTMDDKTANPVLIDRRGAVATITLNRPGAYNAIDRPTANALLDALIVCDQDSAIRCVLITGSGHAFCAGGDIKAMQAAGRRDETPGTFFKQLTVPVHAIVATIVHMEKPVITAVNGAAAGVGFGFALAGDLILAARGATFTMAYSAIGLAPDGSTTFFLPRLVGPKRAYELICLNEPLSAEAARSAGIVNRVFDDDGFLDAARNYAETIAAGPTAALAAAKRLVGQSMTSALEAQMERERQAIAACAGTADFQHGIASFLEKRRPEFGGC